MLGQKLLVEILSLLPLFFFFFLPELGDLIWTVLIFSSSFLWWKFSYRNWHDVLLFRTACHLDMASGIINKEQQN